MKAATAAGKSLNIEYNLVNLPQKVSGNDGQMKLDHTYGSEKVKKTVTGPDAEVRLYGGGMEQANGLNEAYHFGDGRLVWDEETGDVHVQYLITDHLGNTVVLFEDKDEDGEITTELTANEPEDSEVLQRNHYYPFGMSMKGGWNQTTMPDMDYLYNGKEFNEDLGLDWSDYGARYYDAAIGRWNSIDPNAEKYGPVSSFAYVGNSPLIAIDPDGRDIIIIGSKVYQAQVRSLLFNIAAGSERGYQLVQQALSSPHTFTINNVSGANDVKTAVADANDNSGVKNIIWSLNLNTLESESCSIGGDCTTGGTHEFQHFADLSSDDFISRKIPVYNEKIEDEFGGVHTETISSSEISAVFSENEARAASGYDLRQTYAGRQIFGVQMSTTSHSHFENNGLKSEVPYWNLKPIKNFSFNPDLVLPSASSINKLYQNLKSSPVTKQNYSTGGKKTVGVKLSTR